MEFIALGETDDVAASCHFLNIEGTGIVLDAGVDPRTDGPASLPRFDIIHGHRERYVDHAIVTHAHHDHIGSLPVLIREFPHLLVHMTDATKRLIEFLLPASARLQERKLYDGETEHEPLFTEEELSFQSHIYLTHALGADFDVTGTLGNSKIKARFYTAGHILGSVGVELRFVEDGKDRRVFYTSDTNMRPQSIIPGAEYPDSTDVLILESTLANDEEAEQTNRDKETQRFRKTVKEVMARGGTALIPVFVMGRAQETLALIDEMKEDGVIDEDIPVYTAGSMRAVADLYDKTRQTTPRLDSEFKVFGVDQRRMPRSEDAKDDALDGPCIVVASSGMMFEPTLSNRIGRRIVENERDAILLVGYSKEDTASARLQEAAKNGKGTEVVLHEATGPQPVNCTVDRFRFSGHSNRRDLLRVVDSMEPESVVLVHGEPDARQWMHDQIKASHPEIDVYLPAGGEVLNL
ncbi:Ysh1p: subunit of polyadenylation factor I [Longibacter salinarum]|uniref:Ysh1p: subunit of polyadenylation factor I n=1 Tax=Longibacter salinarum TaxID=1850348 RepID=A0A2A8CZP2_9BACT|nr:MBL fold metallo-hydrolase [Longibacter salinarum]PEN13868.1 Ysh1p: subunit of polyadenylation factor I [Longibacter salinarum]